MARVLLKNAGMLETRFASAPCTPARTEDADVLSDHAFSELIRDACAYRNRRYAMLTGSVITCADLGEFEELESRLRSPSKGRLCTFKRFPCSVPALLLLGDGEQAAVQVTNFAADGVRIDLLESLHLGQHVKLSFALAGPTGVEEVTFHGRVHWGLGSAAGITFSGDAEASLVIAPAQVPANEENSTPDRLAIAA